jgi:uncharacterized repeat protein (TIGR03809 family)
MAERHPPCPYDGSARKWRDLAERRRQHFVELQQSGRWSRYYDERRFLAEMQDAIRAAEAWARIASDAPPVVAEAPSESGGP